jgi:hypothetical protein
MKRSSSQSSFNRYAAADRSAKTGTVYVSKSLFGSVKVAHHSFLGDLARFAAPVHRLHLIISSPSIVLMLGAVTLLRASRNF